MSLAKEKIDEIIQELNTLNPEEIEQVLELIRAFKLKSHQRDRKKPSDYRGVWAHLDINVEEECKKMREEWDHRGWDSISNER